MRLALAAGRLDVDQVLRELGSHRLMEWWAFEQLEGGFGDRAAWQRTALLAQMYHERNRDPKRRAAPFKITEFLPWIERPVVAAGKLLRAQLAHLVKKKG